jgi:hypothetical protein
VVKIFPVFFWLLFLTACSSDSYREHRPSIVANVSHRILQNKLRLKEHPDSKMQRRVFVSGNHFVILEPGLSRVRVGRKILTSPSEIRLWNGQLFLPKSLVSRISEQLKEMESLPLTHPEWIPVNEKSWDYIVIHHSAINSGNAAVYDRFHRVERGWSGGLGYHFVIGNGRGSGDGQIEVGPRWYKQMHGAHARSGPGNLYNLQGIGICLVGNFDEELGPTKKQMTSLLKLVSFLRDRYHIDSHNVLPHREVPQGTVTDCPGKNFPWSVFLGKLQ